MNQPKTEPLWKQAFPDFDGLDFEIPEGFEDNSWRNDACPSFVNEELELSLYVNYRDPALREVPGAKRFALFETIDGECSEAPLADTDDLPQVLSAIEDRRASRAVRPT